MFPDGYVRVRVVTYGVDAVGLGGTGCTYVWKAVAHRHVVGGVRHKAQTIADCQSACVNDTSCVGVDFNNQHQCYLIRAGTPGQGTAVIVGEEADQKEEEEHGCVHYDLKRTCGAGQLSCVLYIIAITIHDSGARSIVFS